MTLAEALLGGLFIALAGAAPPAIIVATLALREVAELKRELEQRK